MQAYEFTATVTPEGKVEIPAEVTQKLPVGKLLRLIVFVDDQDEAGWKRLTAEQFLAGYAEADSIYDEVSA
jgi:bifunctional DNA-binding transcriptional regulator/antitoxin component of YhaV-PrlF toxin-antitoxin module